MNLSPRKKLFVDTATEMFGAGAVLTNTIPFTVVGVDDISSATKMLGITIA